MSKIEVVSVDFLVPIAVKIKSDIGYKLVTGKLDCIKNSFYPDDEMSGDYHQLLEKSIIEFIRGRDAIDPDLYTTTDPTDYDLKETITRNMNERSI
jgi:hypothetical protein